MSGIDRAATGTTGSASKTFTYDSNGYLASQTDWDSNQTSFVNDAHGSPTTITEAVGTSVERTTTIAYDSTWVRMPATITTPGITDTRTYDAHGQLLTKTLTDTVCRRNGLHKIRGKLFLTISGKSQMIQTMQLWRLQSVLELKVAS